MERNRERNSLIALFVVLVVGIAWFLTQAMTYW
jgi:hypothetical protein